MRTNKVTMVVEITQNCEMSFYDPTTGRKEWYGCDMFRGEKVRVLDVLYATPTQVRLLCVDEQQASLPLSSVCFSSVSS